MMEKSLWIADSCETNYPELKEDINAEVCIIGGGIVGAITAYLLEKNGVNVVVLEKDKICMGVTANSTAKLTSQHGLFYKYLENENGLNFAKKYLESNEEGIKLAEKIIKEETIDCDYEKKDAYVFATNESELKKIEEEIDVLKRINYDAELEKNIDIPVEKCLGAVKFKNQAQFNSRKYVIELFKIVSRIGGKIYENSKVENIQHDNAAYNISANGYNVKAKNVVISTHYPIKNFPGMYFSKMYQDKSYAIAVDTKQDENEIIDGMFIQSCDPVISFRTAKYKDKNLLIVAGSGHRTGQAEGKIEDSFVNLENYIKKYYPNAETKFKWSTEDCVTLDKVPYIGQFSNLLPNMYVATGFKKWGMSTSHVAGKLISDLILGKENEYVDIYKATRLEPIKNIKEFGNMLKESTYSLLINKIKPAKDILEKIPLGDGGIVEIDGDKVGIYKRDDGEIFAVKPYCGHLGCLVSWNNLEKTWDCPCHGSRYDYMGNIITEPTVKKLEKINIEYDE
ncbi:MAG: FAD-dependent oxidoreductase [Clostridia bacterium]|nr:FAD-dependent oxidoreductase [Clostridia bacterium]